MRVLLADDQTRVRSALRLLIDQEPDFEVVGEVEDPDRLLDMIEECQPDLLLLDWEFLPNERISFIQTLEEKYSYLYVIVLSACMLNRQKALSAGAYAFVSKVDPVDTLIKTLRNVSNDPKHEFQHSMKNFRADNIGKTK